LERISNSDFFDLIKTIIIISYNNNYINIILKQLLEKKSNVLDTKSIILFNSYITLILSFNPIDIDKVVEEFTKIL